MESNALELLFLGTGTSAGVPMIGCHCDICHSTDPRDKRSRPSVVISYGNTRVLIDTTPELRLQCLANDINRIDCVVYTHAHADHLMGLDDLRRFNAIKGGPLDIWATPETHATISRCFDYAFHEPPTEKKLFRPHLIRRNIEGPFDIAGQTWQPIPLVHGDLTVLGFRIGRLAYCTDVNAIPATSFNFLRDLDVLVLDALQYKTHATHLSVEQAIEHAGRIGAKQTWFTHIAHAMAHEPTNAALPQNMQLAHDGQRITARLG